MPARPGTQASKIPARAGHEKSAGGVGDLGHGTTRRGEPRVGEETCAAYVTALRAEADVAPEGFVTHTTWWWVEEGEVLGRIDLHHGLTAALREAARRGSDPVLVTCDHDDVASRRVIERNGGVPARDRGGDTLRFWLPTG